MLCVVCSIVTIMRWQWVIGLVCNNGEGWLVLIINKLGVVGKTRFPIHEDGVKVLFEFY